MYFWDAYLRTWQCVIVCGKGLAFLEGSIQIIFSYSIGLTLWWLEFAAMIAPCVLACCFAPVLVCCLMRGGGSGGGFSMVSEQHFTPEEVRNSLPTIKFSQVSRSSTASKTKTPETQPPPTTNETARIGIYPDMASTLTGLPFPSMDQLGISQAKGKTEIENFDTCQICLNQFQV